LGAGAGIMGFFWAGVGAVGFFWTGFLGAVLGFFDLAAFALATGADFLGGFLDLPAGFFFLATPDLAFFGVAFFAGGFFFAAGFFLAEGIFLGDLDDFDVFFLAIQVPR
jgi:hypothetical protein